MALELYVADVVDDHKIKMDAMRLKIRKIRKICHSYRGLVSLCRWISCYIGCDYDRICFRIEMFYKVSVYGLINLDALQSFMLLDENYVCTLVLMWWWTYINLVT